MALKEYGSDNTNANIYRFSYYGEEAGEPEMPYRYAFSGKDAWGFCNGRPTLSMARDSLKAYPNFNGLYFNMYCKESANVQYNKELNVSNTSGEAKGANGSFIYAYSLKRIIYPTGGYNHFVYESNHYSTADDFMGKYEYLGQESGFGAGMRIKEIRSSANGIDEFKRTFTYSEGELLNVPRFIKRKVYQGSAPLYADDEGYYPMVLSYLEMYGEPYNSISMSNGGGVGYTKVTEQYPQGRNEYTFSSLEKSIDDNEVIGTEKFAAFQNFLCVCKSDAPGPMVMYVHNKREYCFENENSFAIQFISDRYSIFKGYCGTFFNRGLLLTKKVYNQNSRLIQLEENEYENKYLHLIPGIEVQRSPGMYRGSVPSYFYSFYWNVVGLSRLTKNTITEYNYDKNGNNSQTLISATRYTYNVDNLLASARMMDSNGDSIVTLMRYPSDIKSNAIYARMVSKNMLNYPIETLKMRNGAVIGASLTSYAQFGNAYYPAAYYLYKPSIPNTNFQLFNNNVQSQYGMPEAAISDYEHGRIASIVARNNVTTNYVWGYNWEYPIAEIKGISYSQILSLITPSVYGKMTSLTEMQLNTLRTKFGTALISTFTYQPLIGIEVQQSPNRVLLKYGYDSFGKLNKIYRGTNFSNTELIERYSYHVINQ